MFGWLASSKVLYALVPLFFSTKAGTLAALRGKLRSASIPESVAFTTTDWQKRPKECLAKAEELALSRSLIVRSSCRREDGAEQSNAGAFLSVPDVSPGELSEAVEQVIASYGSDVSPEDEILVQPMLANVLRAGVAFTHDPDTCSPYRVVNWSEGEDTTAVTSGAAGNAWRQAAESPLPPPEELAPVVALLEELLALFGNVPADCEFAVTREDGEEVLHLLQARPLILPQAPESAEVQTARLRSVRDKIDRGMRPHPHLLGRRAVYGVMPDWNPAEIIGIRPKPLSLSLYRELVTDSIWAYQRHNYGYRNLRSFPLMLHFHGLPYVDARLSFNSFIPADLDEGIAGRLVDHYVERLLEEPALHDKIEFEIVFSCYTLDLPERLGLLRDHGFSQNDCDAIADSLRKLTNHILHPEGLLRKDAAKLDVLRRRREALYASDADPLEQIHWLLEDAKRYGTLPFAGLARAGFVAVQMLRSLVSVGLFSQEDYDAFLADVPTISSHLARDRATLDKTNFLSRYGHLRPGTYDVLSPRYDTAPDLYFDWSEHEELPDPHEPFTLSIPQMREIADLLKTHGLRADTVDFFDFLENGIQQRELAKFHFTRNLSDALELMAAYAEDLGISREELAFADVSAFQELHVAADYPADALQRSIESGKKRYRESLALSLPPLIRTPDEAWAFHSPSISPNFITRKTVTAPVALAQNQTNGNLDGSIVCIPNADPGYDWLFARPIAGLLTAWGGANSHMAIRAGELGLPAVIGTGERLYRQYSQAGRLRLDCSAGSVECLP